LNQACTGDQERATINIFMARSQDTAGFPDDDSTGESTSVDHVEIQLETKEITSRESDEALGMDERRVLCSIHESLRKVSSLCLVAPCSSGFPVQRLER
jgi:hypothetical protein